MSMREWGQDLLATPPIPPGPASSRRASVGLYLAALGAGLWVLLFKLKAFVGLATTSDMCVVAQLATTWLDGRYLQDNFFGNQLATHTFLSAPVLAPFGLLFGSAGLFVALGISVAAGVVALAKILRLPGVPAGPRCVRCSGLG